MLSSTQRPVGQLRSRPDRRIPTVCVVDPQVEDWEWLAQETGVRFQIVASAEDALRLARTAAVDLWVVNTALPGLSSFELCGMLRSRSRHTAVYLVSQEYSVEAERRAWQAGATLFGCKPPQAAWLPIVELLPRPLNRRR